MNLHHFRNATMIIETNHHRVLVDPMLGPKGTMPTFTFFRFKAKKNPIVDLPAHCHEHLKDISHCLITHKHPDHIDKSAEQYLRKYNIPVTCSIHDETLFRKKGLNVVQSLKYGERSPFLGGLIEGIPARHGYGFVAKPMGKVMGFYMQWPDEKSIYLSSDTIYTKDVRRVLQDYRPDISVVAAGTAQLDIFQPLLMRFDDILAFCRDAPGKVLANHLEAVNHCPTSRAELRSALEKEGLSEKVAIPLDGESTLF